MEFSTKSSLAKNFLTYVSGSTILKSTSLILKPVCLYYLSPEHMGLISLLYMFVGFGLTVLSCGLKEVLGIEFYRTDSTGQKKILNDILVIYLTIAVPTVIGLFYYKNQVNYLLFAGNATPFLLSIVLTHLFLVFFSELFYQYLAYDFKSLQLVAVQVCTGFLGFFCSLYALVWGGYGITGFVIANTVSLFVAVACAVGWYCAEGLYVYCDPMRAWRHCKGYCLLGISLMPSLLAGMVVVITHKLILVHTWPMQEVGLYALLAVIGNLFQLLIIAPLDRAYVPVFFKTLAQAGGQIDKIKKVKKNNTIFMLYLLSVLALCGTVGYFLLKPLAYYVLPLAYHGVMPYVLVMFYTQVFLVGTTFTCAPLRFYKKRLPLVGLFAGLVVVNFIASYLLIPTYGLAGATYAMLSASGFYFVFSLLVGPGG